MGHVLPLRPRPLAGQKLPGNRAIRAPAQPDAAARGVLLALALSAMFWVALGLGMGFLA